MRVGTHRDLLRCPVAAARRIKVELPQPLEDNLVRLFTELVVPLGRAMPIEVMSGFRVPDIDQDAYCQSCGTSHQEGRAIDFRVDLHHVHVLPLLRSDQVKATWSEMVVHLDDPVFGTWYHAEVGDSARRQVRFQSFGDKP